MGFAAVVGAIAVFSALTALVLFGSSPHLKNTAASRIRLAVVKASDKAIAAFDTTNRTLFAGKLDHVIRWLVPAFYVAIISFCVANFYSQTYPLMPPHFKLWWRDLHKFITILLVYGTTAVSVFSDAGTIDMHNANSANRRFCNNNLVFFDGRMCSTCGVKKPARSKHCSTCGRCVMLFDHHCVWINNCVGYYNYRWFLAYLAANINLLVHGGLVCYHTLAHVNVKSVPFWTLITQTTDANKLTGVFVILCSIFLVIVALFTALHLRYLYLGVTTNEVDKWGEIEHLVRLGLLFYVPELHQHVEKAFVDAEPVYISLDSQNVLFEEKNSSYTLLKVASMADLDNIYDKGFWKNAKERCLVRQI